MIVLTAAKLSELLRVNREINKAVAYKTDTENYGKVDLWTDGVKAGNLGDCEDYAIAKRNVLVKQLNYPRENLLMGTCFVPEANEWHAVLLVMAFEGVLVLDNRRDNLLFYDQTGYTQWRREDVSVSDSWVAFV